MRAPDRPTRWLIAALIAALTLSMVTVAAATSDGPDARDGGGSSGQEEPGSPGNPDAPPMVDSPDGNVSNNADDCGVTHTEPGLDPDTAVSYVPCPDDTEPIPWGDPRNAQRVEPVPGMADVRARGFDRAIVNDDGIVTILFVSGVEPCSVLDHVDVDYGRDVTITLYEGHDPSAGDVACIEIGVLKSVTIALDEPLNGRTIVDGAA